MTSADGTTTADESRPSGESVQLVEPARTQLIALASEVLGRLTADQVPVALRPFARFAPAKRRRLAGAALAVALDADEPFRRAVAEVLEQSAPELAAAVGEGKAPAAADPVDVAIAAYLLRPPRWLQLVNEAGDRWLSEHPAAPELQTELDRLRAEVAELRTQLRGEAARTKDAVAAALARDAAELEQLRRTVRQRTRELRRLERERDAALAQVAEMRASLEAAATAHEAELRRHRSRRAEAERTADSARREVRTDRDVDDARLWLLTDTLLQAAAGVRRELSLAPPVSRPADAVAAAGGAGEGNDQHHRSIRDVAAFDRVLTLPNLHVIVDGYNVTKSGYGDLPLAEQRTRLTAGLAALVAQTRVEVTVAFDGAQRPVAAAVVPRGVRVLFSAAGQIADDLIRDLVAAEPAGRPILVVTSDRQVAVDVAARGTWTAAASILLARLDR